MRLRAGTRGGGTIFSAITGLVFYGFWGFLAFGAMLFFADPRNGPNFVATLSSGLLFVMMYWQIAPVISAGFGASLELRKLLIYPIPHGKLFTVEVLLRLTNCSEMLILVAGAAAGLLRNPLSGVRAHGAGAAVFIVSGALIFVATNVLLSAGTRHLLERLFRRARLKEAMMLLLVAVGLLPRVLLFKGVGKAALFRLVPAQPVWPWAAVAHVMLRESAAAGAVLSLLYLGVAYWYGRWQFERSIRYDAARYDADSLKPEREARPATLTERFFRLPARFLPDPLAALVEKELRTFARIPRFRLVYAMSCFFGIVMYLPALRNPRPQSFVMQNALPFMALYGLLMLGPITYWNAFGFDRAAVQGYFSWPIRFRDALVAKNITVALLLVPQTALITLAARAVHMPSSAGKCLETIVVILIASLYWFSVGNISSVRMPRAMDPDRMNQMTNKIQALSIWSAPFLLLPIGLAYWARAVFESEIVFSGVLLFAGMVGGVFYKVGLDSAVSTASRRRESMLMQLSRSDGPLSIN